jgi:hypothetical protein
VSFKVEASNDPGMVLCSGALGRAVRLLGVPVLIVVPALLHKKIKGEALKGKKKGAASET